MRCLVWLAVIAVGVGPVTGEAAKHDLTLLDCLNLAVEHNPQLRVASEQYLTAEGLALKLHAVLYPTANAEALTAPTILYVQINQVLYNRATFPNLRISRLVRDQAVINYRQTLDDVVFQVRQAFASALGASRKDELMRDYISLQKDAVASAQALFEAGKTQRNAVLSVQVTQNRLVQAQEDAQLEAAQSLIALSTLLGVELPPHSRLAGGFDAAVPRELDRPVLIAEALRDRPDLKLLESLRLTQQQQILVDLRNAFPTVGISSNSAFQPPELGGLTEFDPQRNYDEPEIQRQAGNSQLPVSLYFTWTVFDGGTQAGLSASGHAQLESQESALDALRKSIPGEVTGAVTQVRAQLDALHALDALTPIAEVRHSAELDFQAGRLRQVDQIGLEGDILGQESERLGCQIRLSLALAALDHALGRGLLTKPPTPSAFHP